MQDLRPFRTHPFPKPCSQYNTGNVHACTSTVLCGDITPIEIMPTMLEEIDTINRNTWLFSWLGRNAMLMLIAHLGDHIGRGIKIRIHVLDIIMFFECLDQLDHLLGLSVFKKNVILR